MPAVYLEIERLEKENKFLEAFTVYYDKGMYYSALNLAKRYGLTEEVEKARKQLNITSIDDVD